MAIHVDQEEFAKQSQIIRSALGLFSDNGIYMDYSVDIAGYRNLGVSYYDTRAVRVNVIKCIQRDTKNLETVGKTFVSLDEEVIG